jgi:hypothetical protein
MTISRHADATTLALLDATTIQLFDREQHQPARTLLPEVVRHLDTVAAASHIASTEHERHRLTTIHGQAATLAGWLIFEKEDAQGVHRYWDTVLTIAERINDEPLLACVQTHMSYAAVEHSASKTALHLAHSALSHAGHDNRARAWLATRVAQEAAGFGDQATAFMHLDMALESGRDLKPLTPDDSTPSWVRFVDSAYIYAMIANVFSRMKITSDAYIAALWARDTLTDRQTKARALTLAEIACALAAVWQLDEAVWYGAQAAELAEKLEATQAMRRLRAMVALLPGSFSSGAKALLERVMAG